nr:MAG TPA: hypothetical protein [Caudoviricetes sp.]
MNILQDTLLLNKLLYLCIGLEFEHFLQIFFLASLRRGFFCVLFSGFV